MMGYGTITKRMRRVIRDTVDGRRVVNAGPGSLVEPWMLLDLGATSVDAIDTAFSPDDTDHAAIRIYRMDYRRAVAKIADRTDPTARDPYVLFMKWPSVSGTSGLEVLTSGAESVLYIGLYDTLTACGTRQLWSALARRKVLAEVRYYRNDLILFGPHLARDEKRAATRQETYVWEDDIRGLLFAPTTP